MANQKKFGVWMDSHQATIAGISTEEATTFSIIAHVSNELAQPNSSEKNANNEARTLQVKFFKEVASHLLNAKYIHVTGTGQAQEQFIRYLAETAEFKNTKTAQSTSTKMSDAKLLEFISAKM